MDATAAKTLRTIIVRLHDRTDKTALFASALILLLCEACLTSVIIVKVPYTKIDWDAYMTQVDGFIAGERDYSNLSGDTGPLVYPAGFLYAFSALKYWTGGEVEIAQIYFGLFYLINQAIVMYIYVQSQIVPPWALSLLCLSKRIHSIFVLRLFNDCLAMLLLHLSLALFQHRKWTWGMTLFSLALSIKMNVLLFAPPLLVILAKSISTPSATLLLGLAATLQVILGAPFLVQYPGEYISRAFNFGRVFIHFWSVNFKFVPEDIFLSKTFSLILLLFHLTALLLFAHYKWCRLDGGLIKLLISKLHPFIPATTQRTPLTAAYVTAVMFTGNFIGILFARSLHYQFYSWYFHSLPMLLWLTPFNVPVKLLLLAAIELCWNIFPSTPFSSCLLLACHIFLLLGLIVSNSSGEEISNRRKGHSD